MSDPGNFLFRIRERRSSLLFSQAEIAELVGIGRVALAKMETGRIKMPFDIGIALCRIFNSNPAYLIDGKGESAPWVELEELGLKGDEIFFRAGVMDFLDGYQAFLKKPLIRWIARHPPREIVDRQLKEGAEAVIKRSSRRYLLELRSRNERALRACAHVATARAHQKIIDLATQELESRVRIPSLINRKDKLTYIKEPSKVLTMDGTFDKILEPARTLCAVHGRKTELAQFLGVSRQMVHSYLAGASAPSAEKGFLLQKWVKKMERKKEILGSAVTLPRTKTQKRKSDHENTQSSQGTS